VPAQLAGATPQSRHRAPNPIARSGPARPCRPERRVVPGTIIREQGGDGLIGRCFQRILASSPEIAREPLVAAKILTALVPETPGLRMPKTIEELGTIV
jgi:hypothetical protein